MPSAGTAARRPTAAVASIAFAVLLLLVAVGARSGTVKPLVPFVLLVTVAAAGGLRVLLRWKGMLTSIVLVVFFIPFKRYTLPATLPFQLDLYRILIAFVLITWVISLMMRRGPRIRRTGLEGPIVAFIAFAIASAGVNAGYLGGVGLASFVIKALTFSASYLILLYFITAIVTSRDQIDRVIRVMVRCGVIVALAAVYEYRSHDNLFNNLHTILPFLTFHDPAVLSGLTPQYLDRSGGFRAFASAEHPIELSAVLAMLVPLAMYLVKTTGQRRWLGAALALGIGVFATLSRTGIVILFVELIVFLRWRPAEVRRYLPLLAPAMCIVYAAAPHTFGSLYAQFFPQNGIVAQQDTHTTDHNALVADGRLARIGPNLHQWLYHDPLLGTAIGSRQTSITVGNATSLAGGVPLSQILDDQWLGNLLMTGALGVAALIWFLTRWRRSLTRVARLDNGKDGWLAVSLVAPVTGFVVSMFTFDAFGFTQVSVVFFFFVALGCALRNARLESVPS